MQQGAYFGWPALPRALFLSDEQVTAATGERSPAVCVSTAAATEQGDGGAGWRSSRGPFLPQNVMLNSVMVISSVELHSASNIFPYRRCIVLFLGRSSLCSRLYLNVFNFLFCFVVTEEDFYAQRSFF